MPGFLEQMKATFSLGGSCHIGIDVGASAVKVVALKNNNGASPKVIGVGIEETPMGCLVDGVLNDTRTMAEVLRAALSQTGINCNKQPAIVGLRGLNVVFKKLLLPFQNPEEMAQQIWIEAQQQVDSDLTSWIIDHQILGVPDVHGQVPVMLVAAKRTAVEEYAALLKMVGLSPLIFDCDVFAIENALEHASGLSRETIMCLDIGQDSTKINIIQDGIPTLTRSFSLGGANLTEQIAKSLAVEYSQAETMKVSASVSGELLNQPDVERAVRSHIDEICEEIKRTLDFFANSNSDTKIDSIDKVVFSGGGSSTRGLAEGIGRFLKCNVEFASPFSKLTVAEKFQETIGSFPHIYTVAVGLALRYQGDKPI